MRFFGYGCLFLFISVLMPVQAQRIDPDVQTYVSEGDAFLAEGRRKEARQAYRTAVLADRSAVLPHRRLGEMAAQEEDWGEVRKQYNRVLDRKTGDLDAHYYVGIADRELGRFRPPLVQDVIEWRRARKHFEQVLEQDSTHRDVLYQYALLRGYQGGQGRWREAIALGHAQVRLRPDLPDAHIGLFQLYERYLSRWHDDDVHIWLEAQAQDHARFFIGEVLRAQERFDEAEAHFRTLLNTPLDMPRAAVYLTQARLYTQLNQSDSAEAAYGRAVDGITNETEADLIFEDTKYLVSDAELAAYRAAQTPEAWQAFFRSVWVKRDPIPAAAENPRLQEHYRRLVEAEKSYTHYGMREWFNNPDKLGYLEFPEAYQLNHKFNDKGLVYIRHGPPNERAMTLNETDTQNESWRYFETGEQEEMIFHFTVDAQAGGGANWRLTPILTEPAMLRDRVTWGHIYQRMLSAVTDPNAALDQQVLQLEMAQASRADVEVGLQTDRHTWRRPLAPLSMPYQLNAFRGEEGQTDVEVCYMLPLSQLAAQATGPNVEIETGLAVHDRGWQPLVNKQSDHRYGTQNRQAADVIFGAFYFTVPPDSYHVALHAQVPATGALAGWKFDEQMPDFSTTDLNMSGLLLAYVIRDAQNEETFVRDDLYVLPNPTRSYRTDQPVFVYFEVYNLLLGEGDRSAFTVDYTLTPVQPRRRGLRGLFRRRARPALSLSFERDADGATSTEYAGIDVSGVEPGEYTFSVTITDTQEKSRTVTRERQVTLYEVEPSGQ